MRDEGQKIKIAAVIFSQAHTKCCESSNDDKIIW